MNRHKRDAERAAMRLDRIGMDVIVTNPDGQEMHTRLASLPWTDMLGFYIVKVEGLRDVCDCSRVRVAAARVECRTSRRISKGGGLRMERGGA
ncbi:MAG: hypothetical protein ABMA13_18220 [Chthoniobacteraceae bacterium]